MAMDLYIKTSPKIRPEIAGRRVDIANEMKNTMVTPVANKLVHTCTVKYICYKELLGAPDIHLQLSLVDARKTVAYTHPSTPRPGV